MKKLYKPWMIFLLITLPQLGMMGVFGRVFWFLHTELTGSQILHWQVFGSILALWLLGCTFFGVWGCIYKKEINLYGSSSIFIFYLSFLTGYFLNYQSLIPGQIPNYLLMGISPAITFLTLIMPGFGYSMLMIIIRLVEKYQMNSVVKPLFAMLAIPLAWYIMINAVRHAAFSMTTIFSQLVQILFILSATLFVFLFTVMSYILITRKFKSFNQTTGLIIFFASLLGLILNQSMGNLFGDFSHMGFYIANVITTGLIAIPAVHKPRLRLGIFAAKGCLIWYSLYFCIVFLPYIPLSMIGVIILGLGVLLLVPAILLIVHGYSLWQDYEYLKAFYQKKRLIGVFVIQILILPIATGAILREDQKNLDKALSYVYQRSYAKEETDKISPWRIKRTLNMIKGLNNSQRPGGNIFGITSGTPYLSSLYHYYVLDNMTISMDKVKTLEKIFLGREENEEEVILNNTLSSKDIALSKITSKTVYDREREVYRSWIHFDLENKTEGISEFYTTFKIPAGTYISNYYLYVGDEKKYGMIADKRAANWIYEQNKMRNQDPGVLTYLSSGEVEFKIFPFLGRERRLSGFELLHPSPIEVVIEGEKIELKPQVHTASQKIGAFSIAPHINYLTKELKNTLPEVIRSPRYYFLLDYSKANQDQLEGNLENLKNFIEKQNLEDQVGEIIGINFEENRIPYDKGWEELLKKTEVKGGFYPDYTLKKIWYEHYTKHLEERPIFVLVTGKPKELATKDSFAGLDFISPEGLSYYVLDKGESLIEYSLGAAYREDTTQRIDQIAKVPVRLWQAKDGSKFYLSDHQEDGIIIEKDDLEIDLKEFENTSWEQGILLESMYRSALLNPDQYFQRSLDIVKGSIMSQVMSPLTSFIVLETELQEKVMLEKQKQLLESQKPWDIEDMTPMEEPSLLWVLGTIMGLMGIKAGKKKLKGKIL